MNTKYYVMLAVIASMLFLGLRVILAQETNAEPSSEVQKIAINSASLEELQSLPEITPEIAEAIINGRPYVKVEDLLNVEGIDENKLAQIRKLIEVDKLNVNFATLEELVSVPGVTPEIAKAIINGRPYVKVEDLLNVEGIGKEELATFQEYIEATLEKKQRGTRGRTTRTRSPTEAPIWPAPPTP